MAALDLLKFNVREDNTVYNPDILCVSGLDRN